MTMRLFLATPSFNQAHYLAHNLHNVDQLGPDVDHHVQDAASTDGTQQLLRGHRGVSFDSRADGGMYDALNRAFALGRGDILGWLNCDDLLLPYAATAVLEFFAAHPGVDVVYGDALELRGERVGLTVTPPPPLLRAFFCGGSMLPQPAVFFRRHVWEGMGGLDTSYKLLADGDLWLRALRRGTRFGKLWELLAVQRMVAGQLMERHAALARAEWDRLRHVHNLPHRRSGRLLSSALLRVGISSLVVPQGPVWPRARRDQVVALAPFPAWPMALWMPSGGRMDVRAGAGLRRLLETPASTHNGGA